MAVAEEQLRHRFGILAFHRIAGRLPASKLEREVWSPEPGDFVSPWVPTDTYLTVFYKIGPLVLYTCNCEFTAGTLALKNFPVLTGIPAEFTPPTLPDDPALDSNQALAPFYDPSADIQYPVAPYVGPYGATGELWLYHGTEVPDPADPGQLWITGAYFAEAPSG